MGLLLLACFGCSRFYFLMFIFVFLVAGFMVVIGVVVLVGVRVVGGVCQVCSAASFWMVSFWAAVS